MIEDVDSVVILESRIPRLLIETAGGLHPFQAEGMLQGLPFYYRSRSRTTLQVGSDELGWLYEACLPPGYLNETDLPYFAAAMLHLIPQLRRTKQLWTFEAVSEINPHTGDLYTCIMPGDDAASAYRQIFSPDEQTLWRYGFTREQWLMSNRHFEYKAEPVATQERTWPKTDPIFTLT